MTRPLPIAACLAISMLSFAVCAQTDTAAITEPAPASEPAPATMTVPAAPVGSAERGKPLTYTCQGCHGLTGYKNAYPNYHVPKIGGQSAQYLVRALTDYKQGKRTHPTMQAQAGSFSDQDIADIAAYLSELKP